MTKKQKDEFEGFMKAKRHMCSALEGRIEVLKEKDPGADFYIPRRQLIEELEKVRSYIRNVVLYEVE